MNLDNLIFKKINLIELKTIISWAKNEGWNPGVYDAENFFKTDKDGFYGIFLEEKLIGGGAIVSYNREFGFMGLFIVKPKYRSKGVGKKLWYKRRDLLISRLNKDASIGMDGVIDMQPFYKKGGFKIAFRSERYENIGRNFTIDKNISKISELDFDTIFEFDKKCFGFSRASFLKLWLNIPESKTYKYTKNNIIKGFAVLRKTDRGYKIGPLFADNIDIAKEIYKACLNSAKGEFVYIDTPVVNKDFITLIKRYNAKYVFECGRMYYGNPPKFEVGNVFGITSFELG